MNTELIGKLEKRIKRDEINREYFDWFLVHPDQIVNNVHEILDGDRLIIFNGAGNVAFNKIIERDTESYYDKFHNKQVFSGMKFAWLPKHIEAGYWNTLFDNNLTAKIIREE